MCIKTIIFAVFSILLAIPAHAQDWSAVTALKPGTTIYITKKSGSEEKGKVGSVTDTAVQLISNRRSVTVQKADIQTIHLARRGSRLGKALKGGAIGAGIGVGIGAIIVASTKSDGLIAAAGVTYGLPIGAVIGAATVGQKRGRLIYSAP